MRLHGPFPYSPLTFLAAWRASPQSIRTRVAGVISSFGEIYMLTIVTGFGVGTLFATGVLLVMQMVEDFRSG